MDRKITKPNKFSIELLLKPKRDMLIAQGIAIYEPLLQEIVEWKN